MRNLLIPFRNPAKITFNKLIENRAPSGLQTLAVVLNKDTIEGKTTPLNWLKPYLRGEIMNDLKKGKSLWIYPEHEDIKRMLLVPAIKKDEPNTNTIIRSTAKDTIQQLKSRKIKNSSIAFDTFSAEEVGKYLNTVLIENTEHVKKENKEIKKFDLLVKEDLYDKKEDIDYWMKLAEGVILSRNLVNQSPSLATPAWMQEQAESLFKIIQQVKVSSIVGEELAEKNYGCIYAVGKGATSPPRLVTLQYNGNSGNEEVSLALVGKGVTFDSGGFNLKPTGSIEDMTLDKSGACNVLAAIHCINELKLPINVIGCLALAENMIGKESYKPGDVLTSYSGKTVEITNTDAEGRLCLCDALTHMQKHYKPKIIIDMATLTGACVTALGSDTAGLFTNDDNLAEKLLKCSSCVDERMWRLPIFPEHTKSMKGVVADLKNSGGRYAGASTAAAFLKEFIEPNTKWAHMDIAGPATKSNQNSKVSLGTGFGTQTIINFTKLLTS